MCRRIFVLLIMLAITFQSRADKELPLVHKYILGKYTYTQKGDELIDGKNASITWVLNFLPENKVRISITSWHAPFTCDGLYQAESVNDEIKLTWLPEKNSEMECNTSPPQFIAKRNSGDTLLIKSSLFPWDDEKWFALKKVN